jgi:hypothetical protein
MPTSYTTSLGLALPVQGDLVNSWGDVVNNSITTLVDTAVAGYLSIAITGDHTLTTTAGATNQARNMMLNFTGTLGAASTITAPAVSKLYIITNSTVGSFAITLKTATGIGVSISSGITKAIICNGTDMTEVTSSGGGGGGASGDGLLYENNTIAATSYTITAGKNAMSAGPITVNSGVVITVPVGSVYTIV